MTLKELSSQLDRLNFLMKDPEPGLSEWQTALKTALDDLATQWMTHRSGLPPKMTTKLMDKLADTKSEPVKQPAPEINIPIRTKKSKPTGTID